MKIQNRNFEKFLKVYSMDIIHKSINESLSMRRIRGTLAEIYIKLNNILNSVELQGALFTSKALS